MQLICVPKWVSSVLVRHGVHEKALVDKDMLSRHISEEDLYYYTSSGEALSFYLSEQFNHDCFDGCFHTPIKINVDGDKVMNRVQRSLENPDIDRAVNILVGHPLAENEHIAFKIVELPTNGFSEGTYGLFVTTFVGTEQERKSQEIAFLDSLLEVLYVHNRPIADLAKSGLITAFTKHLG